MGTIRILLALAVVVEHAERLIPGGTPMVHGLVSVQAFFLISGFYMALVLEHKYRDRTLAFYRNRFIRIFPTYWAVLAISIAAGFFVPSADKFSQLASIDPSTGTYILMIVANIFIFGSDIMMFLSSDERGLFFVQNFMSHDVQLFKYHYILQAWSLPLELMFYMMAPFIVHRYWLIYSLLAVSIATKVGTFIAFGPIDPWAYRFFPSELSVFCLGVLAFKWSKRVRSKPISQRLGAPMLVALIALIVFFKEVPVPHGVKIAMLLVLLVVGLPFVFERFKRNRIDREIGELSYVVYLCHFLVIGLVNQLQLTIFGGMAIPIIVGSILVGAAIHLAVSKPIENKFKAEGDRRVDPPGRPVEAASRSRP